MGERGPTPTPTKILKDRGSRRLQGRENEPQPKSGRPRMPAHFNAAQKEVWKRTIRHIESMGLLTIVDGASLERYCVYLVRWRLMEAVLSKFDTPSMVAAGFKADDSRTIMRHSQAESHRLNDALRRIESQFGLNPSARARLSAPAEGKSDPLAELLKARNN